MKTFLSLLLMSVSAFGGTHTIKIEAMKFVPDKLTVKVGDTVEWKNQDFFPHSATSLDKSFNSKVIPASHSWKWKVTKTGTHAYKCLFHPTMKGQLTVE